MVDEALFKDVFIRSCLGLINGGSNGKDTRLEMAQKTYKMLNKCDYYEK